MNVHTRLPHIDSPQEVVHLLQQSSQLMDEGGTAIPDIHSIRHLLYLLPVLLHFLSCTLGLVCVCVCVSGKERERVREGGREEGREGGGERVR